MNTQLTTEEMSDRIKENILSEAKKKPWSYSWKFVTATAMLKAGTSNRIKHIKDTLGLTYVWMETTGLIRKNDVGQWIKNI